MNSALHPEDSDIIVYTDGSCDPRFHSGAWAALMLYKGTETWIDQLVIPATHQRMELMAVIQSLKYISDHFSSQYTITLYTDSQYVAGLTARSEKLEARQYLTAKQQPIANADLVQAFIRLSRSMNVRLEKVKAHAGGNGNLNSRVDKRCRKMVREYVRGL